MKIAKKEKLNIRLSSDEKEKIETYALNNNMSVSEYARMKMLTRNKREKQPRNEVACAVAVQQLVNYVQDKYISDEDTELERMVEDIWENVRA